MSTAHGDTGQAPRWLLPDELVTTDSGRRRRTVRDWLVDLALFLLACGVGLEQYDTVLPEGFGYTSPQWMLDVDPWVGIASCIALWWRRKFPLALGIMMVPALAVSSTAFGAVMVAVLTVAVHRSWLQSGLVTAVMLSMTLIHVIMYPIPEISHVFYIGFISMTYLVPLSVGIAVRARRQLVVSLRRDAQRDREEYRERLAGARHAERRRIAREMHDVLAHRLSLLSVHAGALAYRSKRANSGHNAPLDPADVSQAIEVIRDSAEHALAELGEVLTVLRADESDDGEPARSAPQPDLSAVKRLVDEAVRAGQRVELEARYEPQDADRLRRQLQRTIYRTVQEGLTNARKHAPGARVSVRITLSPGESAEVVVANPMRVGTTDLEITGFGMGLTGLAERVALDGGEIEHSVVDGAFQLRARLPWLS